MNSIIQSKLFSLTSFIATLIGIVVTVVGAFITLALQPRTSLLIATDTPTSLVNIAPEAGSAVSVYYQGTLVQRAYSVVLHITNDGNQSINISDTDSQIPLIFEVNGDGQFADINTIDVKPGGLNVSIQKDSDKRAIVKLPIFNAGDTATIQFIILSDVDLDRSHLLTVNARIRNLSQVQISDQSNQLSPELLGLGLLVALATVVNLITPLIRPFVEKSIQDQFLVFYRRLSDTAKAKVESEESLSEAIRIYINSIKKG